MQSNQTPLEFTTGSVPRRGSLDFPEPEESPKVFFAKEILAKDSPSPWVITKTIQTIQIQTHDIKLVRAMVDELLVIPQDSQLEKEFNERADRWERESSIHSSPGEKFFHRDYIRIIGKGERVVPFILKRLEKSKKDWLWALEHIIPEEENPAKGIEDFRDAVQAWLDWGKDKYSWLR